MPHPVFIRIFQPATEEEEEEESENIIYYILQDGPFTWDESQQGLILSSYYWGYLISQIPAGRISEVFSAKWVMFTAIVLNIICTLLTPVAAQIEPLLMFLRCVEGVGGVSTI